MLALVLILILVLVFILIVVLIGSAIAMGETDAAKAALDLYLRVAITGLSAEILVEMRSVITFIFPVLPDGELAVVMKAAEAGMDVDLCGQFFIDHYPDPRVGFENGQVLDLVGDIELYVMGELAGDLYIPIDLADTGLLVELEDHFPIGDLREVGLPEFHIDGVHIVQLTGIQAAELAGQRDQSLESGDLGLAETVLYLQPVGGRHVDDVVDIKSPFIVVAAVVLPVVDLANLGLEGNDMAAVIIPYIDLVHDLLCSFIGGRIDDDLDIHGDLVLVPGADHDIPELIFDLELVIRCNVIMFIDKSLASYFFVVLAGLAECRS